MARNTPSHDEIINNIKMDIELVERHLQRNDIDKIRIGAGQPGYQEAIDRELTLESRLVAYSTELHQWERTKREAILEQMTDTNGEYSGFDPEMHDLTNWQPVV